MNDIKCLEGLAQIHVKGGDSYSTKHWWKLYSGEQSSGASLKKDLRMSRYNFKHNDSHARLAYLTTRATRGMISYHKRPIAELRSFCATRGLKGCEALAKDDLIQTLERRDEQAEFTMFMELPPELRVLVYEQSFDMVHRPSFKNHDDWRARPFKYAAPPLASVSKLLRKEVLPLFYAGGILEISMVRDDLFYWNPAGARYPLKCTECPHSAKFFKLAPEVVLSCVKVLEVLLHLGNADYSEYRKFTMDLPTPTTPYQIAQTPEANPFMNPLFGPDQSKEWEKDLGKVLGAMVPEKEEKAYQLQRGDIDLILKVFERLFNKELIL